MNLLINLKLDFYPNVGLICRRIYCARFASRSNVVHCCWHVGLYCCKIVSFFLHVCGCVVCFFNVAIERFFDE